MIEFTVTARENTFAHIVVNFGIPLFRYIRYQSVDKPGRHAHQRGIGNLPAHRAPINRLIYQCPGHSRPDLLLKVGIIAIEIDKDFIFNDMGNTADIILLFTDQTNIALLKIGEGVENDEFDFITHACFQQRFQLRQYLFGIPCSVYGQFLAIQVEISVKIIETIVCPEKVSVLDTAFTERHL